MMGPLVEFYGMLIFAALTAVGAGCLILGVVYTLHRIYWRLTDLNTHIIEAQAQQLWDEGDALAKTRLYMVKLARLEDDPDFPDETHEHDHRDDPPPHRGRSRY